MLAKTEVDVAGQQLLAMADYIEEHGWCQDLYQCDGRVCILGAARAICTDKYSRPFEAPGVVKLAKHIDDDVAEWNDVEGRTQEQVIDKLREVAYL